MAETELREIITDIVDRKLAIFKTELSIELLPIRLAIESHDKQMAEWRAGNAVVVAGQARLEGMYTSSREEQRRQHAENSVKLDQTLRRLDSHLGEHTGHDKHKAEVESHEDRVGEKRRSWFKIVLGAASSGTVIKWIHDHWGKFHSR